VNVAKSAGKTKSVQRRTPTQEPPAKTAMARRRVDRFSVRIAAQAAAASSCPRPIAAA